MKADQYTQDGRGSQPVLLTHGDGVIPTYGRDAIPMMWAPTELLRVRHGSSGLSVPKDLESEEHMFRNLRCGTYKLESL